MNGLKSLTGLQRQFLALVAREVKHQPEADLSIASNRAAELL
ncbi:MAG: hypothetical protein AAFQ82_12935 [Myxococcota bacterium]